MYVDGFFRSIHQLHIILSVFLISGIRQGSVILGFKLLTAAGTSKVRGCLKMKCVFLC